MRNYTTQLLLPFCFVLLISNLHAAGKLSVVVNDVKVDGKPAKKDDVVKVGSTISTGPGARAVLVTTRQSAVRIAENSELVVEDLDDSKDKPRVLLDLKNGGVGALIKKNLTAKMDFRIKTPTGVAAARGTFYSVAVENGKGYVKVKEGKVAVTPANQPKGKEVKAGVVAEVEGSLVQLPIGGGQPVVLKKGDKVLVGSTVKTGKDSKAVIRLTEASAVEIAAETETVLEVVSNAVAKPKVVLDLKNGTLSALINPNVKNKMDFRIRTPTGVAAARGTFYSVAVDENGRGYVSVKEGAVDMIPMRK